MINSTKIQPTHEGNLGQNTPRTLERKGLDRPFIKNAQSDPHHIPDERHDNKWFTVDRQVKVAEPRKINEQHLSRHGTKENPCVNFLNHTVLNSDVKMLNRPQTGGCFETNTWSKKNSRMGTASEGHHKQFIIS